EVNRMIAREMLLALGLRVIEAADGAAALAVLDRQAVDLVLMDLQMPVMDGFAATRTIRQRERALDAARVPIIAVTANAFDEDARRALGAGMDAHLAKPYSAEQLRAVLRQWL
ncbi:MAG TPA: response regulator, partial [Burkholderiaceae bacterium]